MKNKLPRKRLNWFRLKNLIGAFLIVEKSYVMIAVK